MKLAQKRYMLVEYAGTKQRIFETKKEVEQMLADTRKYNDRKTAKYLCGNISVDRIDGKYLVTIHLYNKLSAKNTITNIDGFTRNFTKPELQAYFAPRSKMQEGFSSDINIAYLESKDAFDGEKQLEIGVKYLPIFYKGDEQYFDDDFIDKCLYYHAEQGNTEFFKGLAYEFRPHHAATDSVERLYYYVDGVEHLGMNPMCMYYEAKSLYKKIIAERQSDGSVSRDEMGAQQISNRRRRDFVFYIKNYNARKKPSPLKYNGSIIEMRRQELIDIRDSLVMREDIKNAQLLLIDVSKKRG